MGRIEALARLKEKLRAGEIVLGIQHSSGSAAIIEVVAYCGFDFAIVDTEHSATTTETVESLIRAAEAVDLVAFVRLLKNDKHLIMQALDSGATGVLIPHTMSRADCEQAMSSMRYRPVGRRGKSTVARAPGWGARDWAAYEAWANSEPLCIPIIEDREAVEAIEEIVETPGLEVVAVGPGDLSHSYGFPGQGLRAEPVMEGLRRVIAACRPRGIAVMAIPMPDMTPEFVLELAREGAQLSWFGADVGHLATYLHGLVAGVRSA
jgi:4-hydroxy-2-oxoheptanedioate aldolase